MKGKTLIERIFENMNMNEAKFYMVRGQGTLWFLYSDLKKEENETLLEKDEHLEECSLSDVMSVRYGSQPLYVPCEYSKKCWTLLPIYRDSLLEQGVSV